MSNHHQQILLDITKVGAATIAATTVTIADVNRYLTTVSLLLAISYTIYKFIKDRRE